MTTPAKTAKAKRTQEKRLGRTPAGRRLEQALKEVLADVRGAKALPVVKGASEGQTVKGRPIGLGTRLAKRFAGIGFDHEKKRRTLNFFPNLKQHLARKSRKCQTKNISASQLHCFVF